MPNGGNPKAVEEAAKLYENIRILVIDFVQSQGMQTERQHNQPADYKEWYHEGTSILFGTNLSDINFRGIRRQVTLAIDPRTKTLFIDASAYQDQYMIGRKSKSFPVGKFTLPLNDQFLPLLGNALEIAWRVANSITEAELLPADAWREEVEELLNLLQRT